jgi:hypothetical protein
VPQGTLIERIRAGGYGLGGILTQTGIGTPVENGKQQFEINGTTYLLEVALRADFALVLLRHNLCDRACARCGAPQDGQRGKRLMIAAMSLRRMVAIEFGMWRSGRNGGSSGSVTVGYGKLREQRGGTRS